MKKKLVVIVFCVIGLLAVIVILQKPTAHFRTSKITVFAPENKGREGSEMASSPNDLSGTASKIDKNIPKVKNTAIEKQIAVIEDNSLQGLDSIQDDIVDIIDHSAKGVVYAKGKENLPEEQLLEFAKLTKKFVENIRNIQSFECELDVVDTAYPERNMRGRITSNKIDTLLFEGELAGIKTRIDCHEGFSISTHKLNPVNREMGQILLETIWFTSFRNAENADSAEVAAKVASMFDKYEVGKVVEGPDGKSIKCTVLSGPNVMLSFETDTGRLIQTAMTHPQVNNRATFYYQNDSMYPSKIVTYFPLEDRTITTKYNELKIEYKK